MTDGTARPAAEEMRGEWLGGWKEDPATGHLAFALLDGDERPLWACDYCRNRRYHTLAEHEQLLRLAAKAGRP